ncbi:MAG: hypothetical protein WAM60_24360 [Candidatus Promineifilaceae bacterium]
MNDPNGIYFPHLECITPQLKQLFSKVFVSVSLETQRSLPNCVAWLAADDFFIVTKHQKPMTVGEDFIQLYTDAASSSEPDQVLHLCFIDRVAFALQSEYKEAFSADIQNLDPAETPLIFQRSERAWQTHPRNYYELEHIVSKTGEYLFGKFLDFAWCHLAIRAGQLLEILPQASGQDISFIAKIVLALRDEISTRPVDWLAWEDPFITSTDPELLKWEREASIDETRKRLGYVVPMLQMIVDSSGLT